MFTLPALGYEYSSLEPHIDSNTMQIHHTKHHQTYIDKLNAGLQDHQIEYKDIVDLVSKTFALEEPLQSVVRNHGGGHLNHSLFWNLLSPVSTQIGDITSEILVKKYGSIELFKESFTNKALSLFGSGWTWLVLDKDGTVDIINYSNQDNPFMYGKKPILGIDLWEHAYYLLNQNRRNEYIGKWWNVVNRDQIEKNLHQM